MFTNGPDADLAAIHLAAVWDEAPKRHDLRPRVLEIARKLIAVVPRCRGIHLDPEVVIAGAIWELLEATKSEREPAEARAVLAGRAAALRELRRAFDAACVAAERAPVMTSTGPVSDP